MIESKYNIDNYYMTLANASKRFGINYMETLGYCRKLELNYTKSMTPEKAEEKAFKESMDKILKAYMHEIK